MNTHTDAQWCLAIHSQRSVLSVNIRRHSSLLRRWFMRVSYGLIALNACVQPRGKADTTAARGLKSVPLFPLFIPPYPLSSSQHVEGEGGLWDLLLCFRAVGLIRRHYMAEHRDAASSSYTRARIKSTMSDRRWRAWTSTLTSQCCWLRGQQDFITTLHTVLYSRTGTPSTLFFFFFLTPIILP